MNRRIFKKFRLSYICAFVIGALFMTMNVNAAVYTKDVKLTEDSTEAIVIEENAKVTIDLNGKQLEVRKPASPASNTRYNAITINKGAIVTITGNGKVIADDAAVFNNGGTVIIENGTFFSNNFYAVKNLGTMTIDGGLFTQEYGENKGNSSLIANGFYGNLANDCYVAYPTTDPNITLTINGGKFNQVSSTTQTIKGDDWSKTIINNGEFISTKGKLIQASGDVVVNGGTFNGFESVGFINGDKNIALPGTLTIKGGKFVADYIAYVKNEGLLTIIGGDFTGINKGVKNPSSPYTFKYNITGGTYGLTSDVASYLKDGYDVISLTDKKVVDVKPSYKLNTTTYYVEKGKTIKLDYTANDSAKKYMTSSSTKTDIATMKDDIITGVSVGNTEINVNFAGTIETINVVVYELKTDTITKEETTNLNTLINEIANGKEEVKGIDKETSTKLLEAVKSGKTISTELTTKEVKTSDITTEVKEKVNKVLDKEEKIAAYFDINVLLKADDTSIGKITELENKVKVSVSVPSSLPELKTGYTRKYYVIRIHNGETTKLDATLSNGKIVFETDKFSDYVLTYTDEVSTSKGKLDDVPKTSTINYTILFITFSLMALVTVRLLRKN